ncbi:MAG: hypothetical protein L0Z55_00425 [Planctomycetes bacterium]|nr:hypothetical protein [Planctomycetota bacterium]
MSGLAPIEPYVHLPASGEGAILDCRSEGDRLANAKRAVAGLPGLIAHPRAPATLLRGVCDRVWAPLGERGVFVCQEEFGADGAVERSRWSVVAGLDPMHSPFRPVIAVPRAAVDATLRHVRAAGADVGGIAVLYRDEEQKLDPIFELRAHSPPIVVIQHPSGTRFRLWLLGREEGAGVLEFLAGTRGAIAGDVVLYRALIRLRDEVAVARECNPIAHFYNQRDFSVTLASTARIYPAFDDFDVNAFVAALHSAYDVTEFRLGRGGIVESAYRELCDTIRTEGITQRTAGVLIRGVELGFMVKVREGQSPPWITEQIPDEALDYDVEWTERGMLSRLFPPEAASPQSYLADPLLAPAALEQGKGSIATILNPPAKRHLPDLAERGWRLPFGTLMLKPAVPRGLLLAPFQSAPSARPTRAAIETSKLPALPPGRLAEEGGAAS